MGRIKRFFGAVGRKIKQWALPLGVVAVVAWLFLQGQGGDFAPSPPPLGGPEREAIETEIAPSVEPEPEPPEIIEVDGQQIKTRGALVLLNPTMAAPGSAVGVSASGFDPGARVNFTLKRNEQDKGQQLDPALADKGGSVGGINVTIPQEWNGGSFMLLASQADGKKRTQVEGRIQPAAPQISLSDQVGKPGDFLELSAKGFAPEETVGVYLNSINIEPAMTFKVDKSGNVGQGSIRIPFGAVGNHSLIFYGEKSQAPAVVPFTMLSLYPGAEVDQYAIKADNPLAVSGADFGPKEKVRVHLNGLDTPPIAVVETNDQGALSAPARFNVPFALKGKQTLVLMGEKSQATAVANFEVMPYTPTVEPSTYGGRAGTVVTFYGSGFARNEIVHVRVGTTHDNPGKPVSCFKADERGEVASGGAYTIPANAQGGTMTFHFVGQKSDGQATAAVEVTAGGGPSQAPPADTQPFVCPLEQEQPQQQGGESQQGQPGQPANQGTPPAQQGQQPQPAQPSQPPKQNQPSQPSQPAQQNQDQQKRQEQQRQQDQQKKQQEQQQKQQQEQQKQPPQPPQPNQPKPGNPR